MCLSTSCIHVVSYVGFPPLASPQLLAFMLFQIVSISEILLRPCASQPRKVAVDVAKCRACHANSRCDNGVNGCRLNTRANSFSTVATVGEVCWSHWWHTHASCNHEIIPKQSGKNARHHCTGNAMLLFWKKLSMQNMGRARSVSHLDGKKRGSPKAIQPIIINILPEEVACMEHADPKRDSLSMSWLQCHFEEDRPKVARCHQSLG